MGWIKRATGKSMKDHAWPKKKTKEDQILESIVFGVIGVGALIIFVIWLANILGLLVG